MVEHWHGVDLSIDQVIFDVLVNREVNPDLLQSIAMLIQLMLHFKDLPESTLT